MRAGLEARGARSRYGGSCTAGQDISGSLGPNTGAGGLFKGERMWGAVVNRDGRLCAFITSTEDPTQVWPGSQAIAKAKAFTAAMRPQQGARDGKLTALGDASAAFYVVAVDGCDELLR